MENTYRYHPERPKILTIFIVLSILWNAVSVLLYVNSGFNNFANSLSIILLCIQIYGLVRLWNLDEKGFFLWCIPQVLLLIQIARMPDPLPFIIEAIITVLFFYCVGPVWNSLD